MALKSNKKGERRGGRQLGTPNKPKTLSEDLISSAMRLGFLQEVEVKTLDNEGKEIIKTHLEFTGKDGREGYLMWLAMNNSSAYANLLGRQMPTEMNVKSDHRVAVVHYPTIEEARDALRECGVDPLVIEAAMEPKFLQHKADKKDDT